MPQPTEYLTSVSRYRRPGGSPAPRVLAALLSAMLVLGALLPGAAFANEVDSEGEGSAPAEEVAAPGEGPEFEPEGEETVLGELPAAAGAGLGGDAEDTGEGPPVEAEPQEDAGAPPPPTEVTGALPDEAIDQRPESGEAPIEEATVTSEPEPASPPAKPQAEAAAAGAEPVENQALIAPPSLPAEPAAQGSSSASEALVSTEPEPAPPQGEAPPPRPVGTASEREGSGGNLAGRESHTVRPGESLWSIAEALLPRGADNAEIASEVQRLWRLNEGRIGTSDPDMLPVGVKLRLR